MIARAAAAALVLSIAAGLAAAGAAPAPAREAGGTAGPAAQTAAPLTNEDIVRLVIHHTREDVILREIAERPPAYDLDPGVVTELQKVGVSEAIIRAMRLRQGAIARPGAAGPPPALPAPSPTGGPEAPAAVAAAPRGALELVFAGRAKGDDAAPDTFAVTSLPKGAPRPSDAEIGTVSDLALAILCTTGDHVPDHWDTLTPLEGAPRHEVLLFRPGSSRRRERGFDVLALDRSPAGPIPVVEGPHAILVGLAGREAGSGAWHLLASDVVRVRAAAGGAVRITLDARTRLMGGRMTGFHLEQTWKARLDEDPAPAGDAPAPPGTAPTRSAGAGPSKPPAPPW